MSQHFREFMKRSLLNLFHTMYLYLVLHRFSIPYLLYNGKHIYVRNINSVYHLLSIGLF